MSWIIKVSVYWILMFVSGIAFAQTAAEQNPEAVFVSRTYGVPQLNGRLLVPGQFKETAIDTQIEPIRAGWAEYLRTFRLNTKSQTQMVGYAKRTTGLLERILAEQAQMRPQEIETFVNEPARFAFQRLNEFQERDVMIALSQHYESQRHVPASVSLPVTILTPLIVQSYDLEAGTLSTRVNSWDFVALPDEWERSKMPDGSSLARWISSIPVPEATARTVRDAAEKSRFGFNVVFMGIETSIPTSAHVSNPKFTRVILSLEPTLVNPFVVVDLEAERAKQLAEKQDQINQEKAAIAAQREQIRAAEAEGFNRQANAALFETAGLTIGQEAPADLDYTRYDWPKQHVIGAINAFFHAEVPGGQVAFLTTDGQAKSPIVYLARSFDMDALTRDDLKRLALEKLGSPSARNSSMEGIWWDSTIPKDRHQACRLELHNIGLGNAAIVGGAWTRHPMWVDVNSFKVNCGIMASMTYLSGKYAVADTTWWNQALREAVQAQQARQAEEANDAKSNIDF